MTMGDNDSRSMHYLESIARRYGFRLDVPINKMRKEDVRILLHGSNPNKTKIIWDLGIREDGFATAVGTTAESGKEYCRSD